MNLFKIYLNKIKKQILKHKNTLNLKSEKDLENVIVENPPVNFDFDLSSNIAMVLAKIVKDNPKNIAEKIKNILLKEIRDFSDIHIAGPGFLNFRLSEKTWIKIINNIYKSKKNFGSTKKNKKYNIEFVSANPTGPLHVGHCRGAIFGDVLSNLLKFDGNKVTKEYYINDYGNQIEHFVRSVFFRLREIKFKEKYPDMKNLYPGKYVIDIANKILKKIPKINLNDFKKIYKTLKNESLKHSMNLIKDDLKQLGIKHDRFFSETKIVNNNLVYKTVNKLKKNKFIEEGFLDPTKGEDSPGWKKTKRKHINNLSMKQETTGIII